LRNEESTAMRYRCVWVIQKGTRGIGTNEERGTEANDA
jgi:hypothetical protein